MSNEKGGLIKKKKKPIMQPPAPVIKTQAADFSYSPAPTQEEVGQPVKAQKKSKTIGTKTFKVPAEIHTQIHLLSPFMDENKAYMILQRLIDSYVANELTNRQQRQFKFMVEMSEEEK